VGWRVAHHTKRALCELAAQRSCRSSRTPQASCSKSRSCWIRAAAFLATCTCARTSGWRSWRELDVRPAAEHTAGHVPGAVSIPLAQLRQRLRELPRDREIVAYCRGPLCAFAHEAVALLRREGWQARRLADGPPEWEAAGLPVARS
jgi:rhodanese-related sulfurtransferase